jgi:hypothetical protein
MFSKSPNSEKAQAIRGPNGKGRKNTVQNIKDYATRTQLSNGDENIF